MRRLEFSPAATQDLVEIAAYIAADDPRRASSFVDELELRCSKLPAFPNAGRARPELSLGLRSVPEGKYVIFYSSSEAGVRIERILHGARDLPAAFHDSDADEPR
ncbi:MAG TPA: type II toxin-antitoxin system RelE/ParE family toxin [Allosphingosinicella sp.]